MTLPTHVGIPGRGASVGGTTERALAGLLDKAHELDIEAARFYDHPATWAAVAGAANGLRTACVIVGRIEHWQVDDLYVQRFGALPGEVQRAPMEGDPDVHD